MSCASTIRIDVVTMQPLLLEAPHLYSLSLSLSLLIYPWALLSKVLKDATTRVDVNRYDRLTRHTVVARARVRVAHVSGLSGLSGLASPPAVAAGGEGGTAPSTRGRICFRARRLLPNGDEYSGFEPPGAPNARSCFRI